MADSRPIIVKLFTDQFVIIEDEDEDAFDFHGLAGRRDIGACSIREHPARGILKSSWWGPAALEFLAALESLALNLFDCDTGPPGRAVHFRRPHAAPPGLTKSG